MLGYAAMSEAPLSGFTDPFILDLTGSKTLSWSLDPRAISWILSSRGTGWNISLRPTDWTL